MTIEDRRRAAQLEHARQLQLRMETPDPLISQIQAAVKAAQRGGQEGQHGGGLLRPHLHDTYSKDKDKKDQTPSQRGPARRDQVDSHILRADTCQPFLNQGGMGAEEDIDQALLCHVSASMFFSQAQEATSDRLAPGNEEGEAARDGAGGRW